MQEIQYMGKDGLLNKQPVLFEWMPRQCENCKLWEYVTASCRRTIKALQIWVSEAKLQQKRNQRYRRKSKESNLRQKKKHRFWLHLEGRY
ncbi:hypothetical protein Ancab_034145 [Ancistrocladus abbreviatus]